MLVYDTGALVAAECRSKIMWTLHEQTLGAGTQPIVPGVVLAQAWRGGPQHLLSRFLRGCSVLSDDEGLCRDAGKACGQAGTRDIVDALVVVIAIRLDAAVVTSDPGDLRKLTDALGVELSLHAV